MRFTGRTAPTILPLALLGFALLLRLLVPTGWMPDERGFGIRPCVAMAPAAPAAPAVHAQDHHDHAPAPAAMHGAHQSHGDAAPQPAAGKDGSCPFAALGAPLGAAPPSPADLLQPPSPGPILLASRHLPATAPGSASPLPPATGPPLSA